MDLPTSQLVTVYVITRTIQKQGKGEIYSNTRVFSKEWSILDNKCNSLSVAIQRALQTISADSHVFPRYSESRPEK